MQRKIAVLSLLALAASTAGCATAIAGAMGMNQARPVGDTRTARQGVCAYADTSRFFGGTSSVKACAQTVGGDDARGAVLMSEFASTDGERSDPGNWRVVLTAADGRVLLDSTFRKVERKRSALSDLGCFLSAGCVTIASKSQSLPEGWAPGTYQLRYVYLPDQKPVELTITLQ